MDILKLSRYIVHNFSQQSPDGITPMKLQKLLFYVKAWTLVAGYQLISEEDFEHWDYGPVNRDIYNEYKQYGSKKIEIDRQKSLDITSTEKELIDFIVDNYIEFDAFTLSAMTHTEEPWDTTSRNEIISNELIESYYSKQRFAKNFQDSFDIENNPFYPLTDHSFEMDMSREDAEEIAKYSSYKDYKKMLEQAETDFEALMF